MLKKFTVQNYKNFKDEISIDFENIAGYQFGTDCIKDGLISKALIYGRNATGKTNLGRALLDIVSIVWGISFFTRGEMILNANSNEDSAFFSYSFQFGREEMVYRYARLENQRIKEEELIKDGVTVFKCNFPKGEYNFEGLSLIGAETVNTEVYKKSLYVDSGVNNEQLPFLRWLISNAAFGEDSVIRKLANYVNRMQMIDTERTRPFTLKRWKEDFNESLEDPEKMQEFEEFLNVMGVKCKLDLQELPDGQKELYFKHNRLVPFYENVSSGTASLVSLYLKVVSAARMASFIYLDEFDAFYHYEMAEKLVAFIKQKYPECQVIMTSHNTNLMTNRLMRPDCLFILSEEGTLTPLCSATQRELREGHNLEKMYISGEFADYE